MDTKTIIKVELVTQLLEKKKIGPEGFRILLDLPAIAEPPKEKKVEITLRDLCVAWDNARKNLYGGGVPFADHIAKELGLLD